MKTSQAYISGRAAAKVAGLEVEHWRNLDHCAHLQSMTLAVDPLPSHGLLNEVCDSCVIAFKNGGIKTLRDNVEKMLCDEGLDTKVAAAYAAGVVDETVQVRQYVEIL